MKNVLLVLSSPRGNESYSHRVANHVIDEIRGHSHAFRVAHDGEESFAGSGVVETLNCRSPGLFTEGEISAK